ncbi:MAG: nuclear transport factor 2 family protein [Chloroflexota bacterium]
MEKFEQEILDTEIAFARLAREKGIKAAFLAYASEEAVLNRENNLIKGKKEIEKYFSNKVWKNIHLDWRPDFISVSISGDLGYTYGKFTLEDKDDSGQTKKLEGFFHTVWKKEPDGKWRYVWD